ncbi:MAG: phosphate ABC transporter permease subunit PstC [Fimbriimonas ginsengisoli]|uniref:Phosphate ABC transporter permease subunit PstC n=1 Tax=Fimbriimonas ginsengisoli TaxID=1005039 RepID=A0A931PV01_FIMGI|nr:phosphate ABC transporter permease subunit PstC [Fimbriimonas ginsengisoli]
MRPGTPGACSGPSARPLRRILSRSLDAAFEHATLLLSLVTVGLIGWIGFRLYVDSALTRHRYGWGLLTGVVWDVPHEIYGAAPYIFGTLVAATLAMLIAVPLSVGAAVWLTSLAPRWIAAPVAFGIELLAAIPSIIYGLWGLFILCPLLQSHVSPWLAQQLGANPLFAGPPVLTNMLAAGVILAIMVIPFITAISSEVIKTIPAAQREASFALGSTKWEVIRNVVLPQARSGITGAAILGLGRAIGETMAVVMVVGNTPRIAASILQPGYPMPAKLINEFNEAFNDPLQRSALLEIALVLFAITLVINGLARLLILLTRQGLANPQEALRPWMAKLRQGLDAVFRHGAMALLGGLVLLQVGADLLKRGLGGLGAPFELALAAFAIGWLVVRRARSTLSNRRIRRWVHGSMSGVLALCALAACTVLGALLGYVAIRGFSALTPQLFTELPRPPGMGGGGLKSAILGTLELVAIAGAIGVPIGLMGGVFVAEFGRGRLGGFVRFAADVLNGIPSVVIGMFAYAAFVLPFGHFSAWAGGGALAVMMVPTIARTTEEMLKLVPSSYREAALGLGATKSQAIRSVIVPAAKSGILTGIMLGIARIAGETAPLLFTAFGSDQVNKNPAESVSSLTMKIYQYAISPYDDWIQQAWGGALVLLLLILVLSIGARLATRGRMRRA